VAAELMMKALELGVDEPVELKKSITQQRKNRALGGGSEIN